MRMRREISKSSFGGGLVTRASSRSIGGGFASSSAKSVLTALAVKSNCQVSSTPTWSVGTVSEVIGPLNRSQQPCASHEPCGIGASVGALSSSAQFVLRQHGGSSLSLSSAASFEKAQQDDKGIAIPIHSAIAFRSQQHRVIHAANAKTAKARMNRGGRMRVV